ncbi:hypothetical protein [Aeromicrobium sp. Sec7.5]|uniref:hypothetical protein n=1 Tax=Aeromicrobium sp. Sec7.5 TaxID=3121276 RepID=UPI002FE47E52
MQAKIGFWVLGVLLLVAAFYFGVTQVEIVVQGDVLQCGNAIGTTPGVAPLAGLEPCQDAVIDRRVLAGFIAAGGAMSTLFGFIAMPKRDED